MTNSEVTLREKIYIAIRDTFQTTTKVVVPNGDEYWNMASAATDQVLVLLKISNAEAYRQGQLSALTEVEDCDPGYEDTLEDWIIRRKAELKADKEQE